MNAQTEQSESHSLLPGVGTRDVESGASNNRAHSVVSERDSDLLPLKVVVVS